MSEAVDTSAQEAAIPPIRTYQPEDVSKVTFDDQFGPARPEIFEVKAIMGYNPA